MHRRWLTCAALVALSALAQAVTVYRSVVPAQDAVRYLIVAQSIQRQGLVATLHSHGEQPLFPCLVWLAHEGLGGCGLASPANWATSLQVAAALPLLAAMVPVYLLFCQLVGQRAAAVGGVLFALAGATRRLGADGLSDSTHLALFALALWAGCRAFDRSARQWAWLLAAGFFTGLALLARAEAIVLPLAVGVTQLICQARPAWRRPALGAACSTMAFALGMGAVLLPYLAAAGVNNPRLAAARLIGSGGLDESAGLNVNLPSAAAAADSREPRWNLEGTGRLVFGRKDTLASSRFEGYAAALAELVRELCESLDYCFAALAGWAMWRCRRLRARPADRLVQVAGLAMAGCVLKVAADGGYLSGRHLLVLALLAFGWAGLGATLAGGWAWRKLAKAIGGDALRPRRAAPRWAVPALVGLAAWACGPGSLHASRRGHLEAARWLAAASRPGDVVLDSRGWTAMFTGLTTFRYDAAQAALVHGRLSYVVVEQGELASPSQRGRTMRLLIAQAGEPVARFNAPSGKPEEQVVVHRWRPDRFAELRGRLHAR